MSKISFEVSFKEPQAHYAEVRMEISAINKEFIDVKMPVWAPGSYLVREFSKNVEGLEAKNADGRTLKNYKVSKNTWRIEGKNAGKIIINYRVYAFEVSVRTSFIDAKHAFLSPPGLFMYIDGMIDAPATVTIIPHTSWSVVSTGLDPVEQQKNTYYAKDFDVLFDSPIEVGNQDVFSFEAAGVHHEVAMVGGGNYDKDRLKKDMAHIVEEETAIFGVNPNKRYVFIVHNYQSGGGGLEHHNSTVLGAARFSYGNESGYQGFLGLAAHEYFHLWNVKRLRPAALGPFNYDVENYTPSLWISEGFTAYYDNLILRRCGFYSPDKYLEVLAGDINTVENRPGNQLQPVTEASFDAWIKYYRPDENAVNNSISYYNKGALMAMMMDLAIIKATNGQKKLDDVMKAMYDQYYGQLNRGFTDDEFMRVAEQVAGISLADIYLAATTAGTPDYSKYLQYAGEELIDLHEGSTMPDMGIKIAVSEGRITVSSVYRGSGAWDAGVNVKDELIAINGYRLDIGGKEVDRILKDSNVGDKLTVLIARDGLTEQLDVVLKADQSKRFVIMPFARSTAEQQQVQKVWLGL